MRIKGILLIAILLVSFMAHAQDRFKVDKEQSQLSIKGTSTLHDWEIDVEEYSGYLVFHDTEDGPEITDGELTIVVQSLKSGKGNMDKKVYEALEQDDHPQIYFSYENTVEQSLQGQSLNMVISGELTIASKTRNIEVEIEGTYTPEKIHFEGVKGFKMTTYNIEPPSAMFGTIKSGDKITVDYSIIFQH